MGGNPNGKAEARADELHVAKPPFLGEADALEMMRLELAPITDGGLPVGCLRCDDHCLASFDGDLHRLLPEDVLALACREDLKLGMQCIWLHDVHDVDVGILLHAL